jgi:hypothetical protein
MSALIASSWEECLTRPVPKDFDEMALAMLNTEQTPGQSVYQHGASVAEHLHQIVSHLNGLAELPASSWRVPAWLGEYRQDLLRNMHSESDCQLYALYHDCGKPFCRQVDENGKAHFPNHAKVSERIWHSVGGNDTVGLLIANDMVIHTATAEEIGQKLLNEWSCKDAVTLLLASLAELHSNARMFGGVDSTSFKIKWKVVEKRGRQVCKHLFSPA